MGINEKTAENKANDFATSPVPAAERKGFWSTAAVWMGWCISLSAFLTGGTIAAGCSLGTALLAVLLGNLILVGIGSLCGIIGYRTGLTTYTIYRLIFGEKGNVIVSVVMAISLMAFIGVLMDSFSSTLNGLLPWFPIPLATCIFAVCILLSSINGFKGLSFISAIAAPALIILCVVCFIRTLLMPGATATLAAWQPTNTISFVTAVGAATSTWIGGATKTADLTRYSKKASHVIGGAAMGYLCGAALFECVAVICAIGVGESNIVKVMAGLGMLAPAVLVLGLALWTTTDNNIYSSALAFTDMSEILHIKVSRKVWDLVCVLIALVVSLLGLSNNFKVWLNVIGTTSGPLAGIMISHFFIIHKWNETEYLVPSGFGITGFVTWVLSFIIAQNTTSPIPTLTSIGISFVLYIVLELVAKHVFHYTPKGKVFRIEQ